MAKTTLEYHNCPKCGKELFRRGDRRDRWCRKCSYIKIGDKQRGIPMTNKSKNKMSISAKKRIRTKEFEKKRIAAVRFAIVGNTFGKGKNMGENNYRWTGGKYSESYRERRRFRGTLQKKIFERDNYTCQICNKRGGSLQVDHIKEWSKYKELRFEIDNCRTLCMECHYLVTFKIEKPKHINNWGHNFKKAI